MKKTYRCPRTEVLMISTRPALLSGSKLGIGEGELDASESLSRDNDFEYGDDFSGI